jgi:hypothetical protein
MLLYLDAETQELVLALPESGMGFQHLAAEFQGRLTEFLVLNAERALDLSALQLAEGTSPAIIEANGIRVVEAIQDVRSGYLTVPRPFSFQLASARIGGRRVSPVATRIALPSSLVKRYVLSAPRAFHRYSAFNPDRRVAPSTGDFVAGTYAAPESELPFVPTGFVAVGRFALPSALPASHHYEILAPTGTPVAFGTVAPAFGQAGGGVEVLFASPVVNQHTTPALRPALPDE